LLYNLFQNNFWAIGTTVGGEDIQPFTSVGINLTGINSSLEGILQSNQTYYVSVSFICGGNRPRSTQRNYRPAASLCPTLSHNVVSSTPRLRGIQTHNDKRDIYNKWTLIIEI
jgi:hypothetical protein